MLHLPSEANMVIIQRDFPRHSELYARVIDWAQAKSIPIIYEIDDLLIELPPEHPEWEYYREARRSMLTALAEARAVITSTQPLANYARRFNLNTWVLPNYLDDRHWKLAQQALQKNNKEIVLGYMGASHPNTCA